MTVPSAKRIHVIGAGPVGVMLTALLQSTDGLSVHLYEKRREYTRTRMMTLLQGWSQGFCPLNSIERAISDLIDARATSNVQRTTAVVRSTTSMACGPRFQE
jgi:2-polyprenyl-6-methoxyphenol hydroxylase-like FAD-dependent oxidoreductase